MAMSNKRSKYWGNNPRFKYQKVDEKPTNRFEALSDLDDADSEDGEYKETPIKIPPIVVDLDYSFSNVIGLFGDNCKYKRMSVGTKIIPNTLAQYEETIKALKDKNIKFYTHPVKDQNKFKLILFGLPQVDTKDIFEEFKQYFNITPINIKEIVTKRTTENNAIYMIEFDKKQISKKEILRIKYFHCIAVHWRNPLRRSRGPTQCSKCTMFGHGSSNCHRSNNCIGCGSPHDYSVCPLNKAPTQGPVVYKCFNCVKNNLKNTNHRADDARCPSRREYLEIRQRVSRKQRKVSVTNNRPEFNFSTEDFPPIGNNEASSSNAWPKVSNNQERAPRQSASGHNKDDDLSNEKILEIYFEALNALEKCKTKYDKMRVLGNMLKYVI